MKKTNAVLFGKYIIVLEKEQLMYYIDGELSAVKDVSVEFTNTDLYDLAKRIADKKELSIVQYINKSDYIKK
jgi:hypothetical protein